jgi:hypothetical protein
MPRITMVSSTSPMKPETIAAATSSRIMKSVNWASSIRSLLRDAASLIWFGPWRSSRAATSASDRPSAGTVPS